MWLDLARDKGGTAMRWSLAVRRATLLLVMLAGLGSAQSGEPITNEDVIKMVRAQLSTSIILTTIQAAKPVKFDVSPAALVALKEAGVDDRVIEAMQARSRAQIERETGAASPAERDRSEALATSREAHVILTNFKTMFVDASSAQFFGSDQMKAALRKAKGFDALKITIVDDRAVADVVLKVGYTFAWDYPFSLTHQNTSVVLVSGKGTGPFSGPAGANSVATELTKLLKPYRVAPPPAPTKK